MLISMAEISPPDIPPTYKPHKRHMPMIGSTPNVIGKQSATAIVAVNPGIDPKMIPTATPTTMAAEG
jgi:hypothetical protein